MNEDLSNTLKEIADIGQQIAKLTEKSKEHRLSLGAYYDSLDKMTDRETAVVFLRGCSRLAFIKPVRKDGDSGKAVDYTVTFGACTIAYQERDDDEIEPDVHMLPDDDD